MRNLIRQFTKNGPVPSSTFDVGREYVTPSLTLRVMMRVNDGRRLARTRGSGLFFARAALRLSFITQNLHPPIHEKRTCPQQHV
jgi:hypothetical protein